MSGDPRIQWLLEEILDSGLSPEEVCRDDPELLPRVRERLGRVRRVEAQLDALLPAASPPVAGSRPSASAPEVAAPPELSGYEVQEELGRGGMGVVYRAWDRRLNRPVALKVLLAGAYARPEERERFRREAESEAGLRHPNIVQIYDVGDLDGRPYFTMEFVEGDSLAARLAGAPMPPCEAAALVETLADAVQAAHNGGVIHRDLKPANVLLTADGTPKVTDFGLARRLDGGEGLTQTGAVLGTPSYMAPEQAQGDSDSIGPAADVYALGAILYEALTGRPPFRAKTAAETVRQVIEDEPVPPSRCNARLARDLETICLKCLSKEPRARYLSAAALADDLRRFRRGEAITARPPGRAERLTRWLRRRWAPVAAAAGAVALAISLLGGGFWLRSERRAIERGVEEDLREVARLQQAADWSGAAIALERARGRLGRGGPAALLHRLDAAGRGIERARRERGVLGRLDAIHLTRTILAEGRFNHAAERRFLYARADRAYEAAFREAGLGTPGDDPVAVGARLATSSERAPVMAALSDWAVCATDASRRAWALGVARWADPDPWRDRARDPAAWGDRAALAALAQAAPVSGQPAHLPVALGERLHDLGGDGAAFLARVEQVHPDDAWAALTLARTLQEGAAPETAVAPYRRALKLRGDSAAIYTNLGLTSHARRDWNAAYAAYEKALQIDRDFGPAHNNYGLALKGEGKWDDATRHFREAIRLDPGLAPAHCNHAEIRAFSGGLPEAIDHYRQALQIDPEFAPAEYLLGVALVARGRWDEPQDRRREGARLRLQDRDAYNDILGFAAREGIEHYTQALYMDPNFHVPYNNLGLTPRDAALLSEAIEHFERALRIAQKNDPRLENWAHAELGQAFLAQGRFGEAEAATRRCLDRLPRDEPLRANLEAQLRRCRRLLALQARLPAVLEGKDTPRNPDETLEFAELCGITNRFVAAAHHYAEALAAAPRAADDSHSTHRYTAACAAALAGSGRGEGGAALAEAERARWRGRSRAWLRADLILWAGTLDSGSQPDRLLVLRRLAHLWADPDLDGLFDPDAQRTLPAAERDECRALWGEFEDLTRRAHAKE
jgi:serine/threonine-protein kinase